MSKDSRGVTPQSEDFSAWYNDLVLRAELVDRGPARGTMVIRPYGFRIWELLQADLDTRIKASGHDNAYFPLLIPQSYLQREASHVEGFSPELAVVTHAGGKELEEPLVVRPTSETVVGEMMSKWISSHRDLPLLLNQWANVVRWEMRPRMFLRTTEFLWQEGHTAHADEDDAVSETMFALGMYADAATSVAAIPVIKGEKTAGERFAGAARTYSIEAMMLDGKALQSGTSHYMGTNFATAFDIGYTNADGDRVLCHTTSWGMSTRMIGGVIMTHGDDKGLILPPRLAPYQVVIVPITRGDEAGSVSAEAEVIAGSLRAVGVRVRIDDRPGMSPGYKFNEWELRGVPLRLELGPRDVKARTVVVASRLGGDKENVSMDGLADLVVDRLDQFQADLLQRAIDFRDEHSKVVGTWADFVSAVECGWAVATHCGQPSCEDDIKVQTSSTPRCVPLPDEALRVRATSSCIRCDRPSGYGSRVIFGRAY